MSGTARASEWLGALTAILAIGAAATTVLLLPVSAAPFVPLMWISLAAVAGIACWMGTRRCLPLLVFAGSGLIWSVAILGMWSIGMLFVPAALAAALSAFTFSLGRPSHIGMAIVWFAIGLTSLCAFDLLYARSQSYDVRWSSGFSAGHVTVPAIIVYGAWVFALLVSLVTTAAISRKLIGSRH